MQITLFYLTGDILRCRTLKQITSLIFLLLLICMIKNSHQMSITSKEGFPIYFRQSEYMIQIIFYSQISLNMTISLYHSYLVMSPYQVQQLQQSQVFLNQIAYQSSNSNCNLMIKSTDTQQQNLSQISSNNTDNSQFCYVQLPNLVIDNSNSTQYIQIEWTQQNILGVLGKTQFYIDSQQITIQNSILSTNYNNSNNGIFGLANPDRDSSYGHNLLYQLFTNGVITTVSFGICVSSGKGVFQIGDLDISSSWQYQKVYLQNIYDYMTPLIAVQVQQKQIDFSFNARISYQQPYLLIKQALKISQQYIEIQPNLPQILKELLLFNIDKIKLNYDDILFWIKSLPQLQVISQDSKGKPLIFSSSPIFICADAQSLSLLQIQQGIQSNQQFDVCTTYKEIKDSESSVDAEIGNQFLQNIFIIFNISKSYIQFFVDNQCVNSQSVQELNSSPLYYLLNIFQSVVSFLITIIVLFLLLKKLKGKNDQNQFAFNQEEEIRINNISQNNRFNQHLHSD
ncbi:transmembrane protein, putative (macronuclear) [Tetrahymena thermophila SB210]|uniref:Transmembrane protein, putative n=1 Tax=Tetrahymena thermophila (strain SB210) TaxID=312017 RepID=I7LV90_TETTS|nr:transmembrane protein, putative [Tetrahymena thermophila SB210]EAR97441.2 transmembrane protein, putative [Tetrahymena thermophila SB210]|eukprot:XP_001017686.2 transmembrane protein, putative [Tetrahymena thermophila SB210]